MSLPIQPTSTPATQVDAIVKKKGDRGVDRFIAKEIDAPSTGGRQNNYQIADKLDISPEAKKALEETMARQDLSFHHETKNSATASQESFVYNGKVHQALENLADGHGSVADITSAIKARGERMHDVEAADHREEPTTTIHPDQTQ